MLSVFSEEYTGLLCSHRLRTEEGTHCVCKHVLDAVLAECRTLQVLDGVDLASQSVALLERDGRLVLLLKLLQHICVVAEIALGPNQQDGHAGTVVRHLWVPLVLDVLIGRGAGDGEADDEDVGLRVGQRAKAVVLLLTCCVPQVEADGAAVHSDLGAVVVEHGGNVLFGERAGRVRDEQAGFSDRSVPHHHTLDALHDTKVTTPLQQSAEKETLLC